jgi:hypothetical protein
MRYSARRSEAAVVPTLNRVQRALLIIRIEISQGLAHNQTQFDFIVEADALGPKDGSGAREEDGGRGLQEEEGLLGGCAIQLGDMIAVLIQTC